MNLFTLHSRTLVLPLVLLSSAVFAAEPVLVSGGGVAISAQDILAEAQRVPPEARTPMLARPESVAQMGSGLFVRRVLAADAERAGLATDPATAAALQIARDRVLADARLAQLVKQKIPDDAVLEKLAETSYKANPKRVQVAFEIWACHVLVRSAPDGRATAEKLLAELKAGADFATVAKQHSADTGTASKGGDLGFFGRGRMVLPFDEAAFALTQPGALSGVVETGFGFHIIRLEEMRPARVRPFAEMRDDLRREALAQVAKEAQGLEYERVRALEQADTAAIAAFAAVPR